MSEEIIAPVEPQEVADLAPVEVEQGTTEAEIAPVEPQEAASLEPTAVDRARRDPNGALIIN